MRIVVSNPQIYDRGDLSWAGFEESGQVEFCQGSPDTIATELPQRLQGVQCAMLHQQTINKALLDACPELRFITLCSTGYDSISPEVLRLARERDVTISNIPAYGTASVAQHTMALLLELTNHAAAYDALVREGRWGASHSFCLWDRPLMELEGKTMGILGFGRIGRSVARIAAGLGMRVLSCSDHLHPEDLALVERVSREELFRRSDVVSLHCPLTPENRGLINRQTIAQMKDGAILLNTARGGLICDADVAEALIDGKLGGVGLDVMAAEPIQPDNPLLRAPNCLITPHIAWIPRESRQRMLDCAAGNLRAYLAGRPINVVNP